MLFISLLLFESFLYPSLATPSPPKGNIVTAYLSLLSFYSLSLLFTFVI
jgi:hypothetical protein